MAKQRWYQAKAVDEWEKEARANPDEHQLLVLPTGAGKTVVMALIIARAIGWGMNVLVLARSRELVDQNRSTFEWWFPDHQDKVGCYCASLGQRDTEQQVIFASVQSVFKKGNQFGARRLIIIDEAHQIPPNENSQYQTLIYELAKHSDRVKILGLTASPYRLDGGTIFGPGQQFDSVAYAVPLSVLINENYITRPKTLDVTKVDLKGIKKTAGDFNKAQVEHRFLRISLGEEILRCANEKQANSVLIFASGVSHAQALKAELEDLGEHPRVVTGDTLPILRGAAIESFTQRKTRFLINVECLTTGFDAPCVDMVVTARMTESPALFLQMVGRGFRKYPGKDVCWVLDYGGNIDRHGAIDSDTYGIDTIKPPSEGKGKAPTRVCPSCFAINPASAADCHKCGLKFPRKKKEFVASREEILAEATWPDVLHVTFRRHESGQALKRDSVRVTYKCHCENSPMNIRYVSEWLCVEHKGFPRRKAEDYFIRAGHGLPPRRVEETLEIVNHPRFPKPSKIEVKKDGKYDKILDYNYEF